MTYNLARESSFSYGTFCPCGYLHDTETQLYYLQSRYYDPKIGRFLNADALVSTGQGILGNNMFAYCLNGPQNYADNAGYIPRSLVQTEAMQYGSSNNNIVIVHFPSPQLFESGTIIIGVSISEYVGKGGGASLGVAIDSSTDVALVASGSWGAGTTSGGGAAFFTYSTAPDIERALGRSEYVGSSVCVSGFSIGFDYAVSNDTETGKPYHSYTLLIGGKASTPFETHGGISYMVDVTDAIEGIILWSVD